MGALTQQDLAVELAAIDRELDHAEVRPSNEVAGFAWRKGVDWSAPPQDIAAVVRRLWSAILLGQDMRPVRAELRVPSKAEGEANKLGLTLDGYYARKRAANLGA